MKDYIVVDTWNGVGYSDNNGVEIKQFDEYSPAKCWASRRSIEQSQGDLSGLCELPNGYGWEGYDEHSGTYQVLETKDAYAVMIRCNINDIQTLTKDEYYNKIQEFDELYGEHLEDCLDVENNGDRFYHSHVDDYDYQFRLIKNL